jgi:LysM repeat protein
MDENGRILASIVRARSGHAGRRGVQQGWLLAALVMLPITLGVFAVRLLGAQLGLGGSSAAEFSGSAAVPPATPVPLAERVAEAASGLSAAEAVSGPTVVTATIGARRYLVQPGDTLQSIAQRQGLHPQTLVSVNDLTDPDLLQPGRELLVPATDGFMHVVEPGETLRAIAERYGVDIRTIVSTNNLASPDRITVGLRLFVPSVSG